MVSAIKIRRQYRAYFTKYRPLPMLQVYAWQNIIENDWSSGERASSYDPAYLKDETSSLVETAQRELLLHLNALEIGRIVLTSTAPHFIEAFQRCRACPFPQTAGVLEEFRRLALELELYPESISPRQLKVKQIEILHELGLTYAQAWDKLSAQRSTWLRKDWDAYFDRFPDDETRIVMLAAVARLAATQPLAFGKRGELLWPALFDTGYRFETIQWNEYEDTPGDLLDEGDPKEPWQQ